MIHILIPTETFTTKDTGSLPIYGAIATYLQKLTKRGLVPLLMIPGMSQEAVDDLYQLADGVYCMGGVDINPSNYGHEKHEKTSATDAPRDELELSLLRRALQDKKPIFSICRGCQALAIASGGTLIQHVPDIVKHAKHSVPEGETYEALTTNKHSILIEKTSRVYGFLKKEKITANSGHHQAVATVGKDFRISGRSEDGINEIIEHTDPKYFCFAVQPHPEAEEDSDLESLFTSFAQAAADYNKQKGK